MTPSEQFLKFAADCGSMAKLTPDPENEPVWRRLADPWARAGRRPSRHAECIHDRASRVDHIGGGPKQRTGGL
jgi:hypothetical protein